MNKPKIRYHLNTKRAKQLAMLALLMGAILIASILITSAEVDADGDDSGEVNWYTSNEHAGSYCIECHLKFTNEPAITQMFPCAKRECHSGFTPLGRNSVHAYHLTLCGKCHESIQKVDDIYITNKDIHKLHKPYGVNCTNCHTSTGYDSEIAHVSANETGDPYHQDPSCPNCHSLDGSDGEVNNLHDVHGAVLNRACVSCHGEIANLTRKEMKEIYGMDSGFTMQQSSNTKIPKPLGNFFNQIAMKMQNILSW